MNIALHFSFGHNEAKFNYHKQEIIFPSPSPLSALQSMQGLPLGEGQFQFTSKTYYLYGHSAGGQFAHRLVLFMPNARYQRVVAANPGYYTMPQFNCVYWPAPSW